MHVRQTVLFRPHYDTYIADSGITDNPLEMLTLSDGQKFFLHCKTKKPDIKRKYWNNVQGLLNNIFRFAANEGIIQGNPFANLSIGTNSFAPDAKHKDCDTTFSPDEQSAICVYAEETAFTLLTAILPAEMTSA